MRRIKDAPELKAAFDKAYAECKHVKFEYPHEKNFAEHFFLAGRDSLVKELMDIETIAARKPKRTIEKVVMGVQGNFLALSNDGKLYTIVRQKDSLPEWLPYPDLPQEEE